MQGVPEAEQEKIFKAIEENPDFFKNLAEEIQAEMKSGKDQMAAAMSVMQKHQDVLKGMFQK